MGTCPTCGQHIQPAEAATRPAPTSAPARQPRQVAEWERPHPRASQDAIDRGLAAIRTALQAARAEPPSPPSRSGAMTSVEHRAKALAFIAARAPETLPLVTASGNRLPR